MLGKLNSKTGWGELHQVETERLRKARNQWSHGEKWFWHMQIEMIDLRWYFCILHHSCCLIRKLTYQQLWIAWRTHRSMAEPIRWQIHYFDFKMLKSLSRLFDYDVQYQSFIKKKGEVRRKRERKRKRGTSWPRGIVIGNLQQICFLGYHQNSSTHKM